MIFRLMIILVFYQLVFVGFSLLYFGNLIEAISLVAFLVSFLLLGIIIDSRSEIHSLKERIRNDRTSSQIVFCIGMLGVLFFVVKYYLYGVPLFKEDANFFSASDHP